MILKDNQKRFILSYDIIDDAYNEKDIWDALYDMPGLTIMDKPVLSTLLLKSEDGLMHEKIKKMLDASFGDLCYIVCRVGVKRYDDGSHVNCYFRKPNTDSQKQIKDYLESKKQAVKK